MTNDNLKMIAAARRGAAAERVWWDGYAYTKAGIMLDDLVAADMHPRTLYERDADKHARLMGVLDEINGASGSGRPLRRRSSQAGVEAAVRDAFTVLNDQHRRGADRTGATTRFQRAADLAINGPLSRGEEIIRRSA